MWWEELQCYEAPKTQEKSTEVWEYKTECTENKEDREKEENQEEKRELGESETYESWIDTQLKKLEEFTVISEAKANPVIVEAVATPAGQGVLVWIWKGILYISTAIWLTKVIKPILENEQTKKAIQKTKLVLLASAIIALRPFKLENILNMSWSKNDGDKTKNTDKKSEMEIIEQVEPNAELECNFNDNMQKEVEELMNQDAKKFMDWWEWKTIREILQENNITLNDIIEKWSVNSLWELQYYLKNGKLIKFSTEQTRNLFLITKNFDILPESFRARMFSQWLEKGSEIFNDFIDKYTEYFEQRIREIWPNEEELTHFIQEELQKLLDDCLLESMPIKEVTEIGDKYWIERIIRRIKNENNRIRSILKQRLYDFTKNNFRWNGLTLRQIKNIFWLD